MFDLNLFKISLQGLKANKLRTFLTVLGVVIGIAAIIMVFSAGEAVRGLIVGEVESFGTDIIQTEIKIPSNKKGAQAEQESATGLATGVQVTTLTLDDMEDVKGLPNVVDGYGATMNQKQVTYGSERKKSFLLGVSSGYIDIDKSEIETGRFFSSDEDESLAPVAVIGSEIKKELFGDSYAVGRSIKIDSSKFRVIGVMKERGSVFTMDFDNYIYVPIKTLQKRIMGVDYITYMVHSLEDPSRADTTANRARSLLRRNHDIDPPYDPETGKVATNKDDFRVVTMQEMMDLLDTVTNAITFLLLGIVGISLIVGGVGIMNIMYVIINERTQEIGLRKAVGAKKRDILTQFLIESTLITLLGGIGGVVLGVAASYLISQGAASYGLAWDFVIPLRAYGTALVFSIVCGILFGLYPAKKASDLDPLVALRQE